jgi:adenosylhomocysteine nucleosidase
MRVLITFAADAEFAPWRQLRKFRKTSGNGSGAPRFGTAIGDTGLEVLLTGIGRVACEQALAKATDEKPDLVISSGLAGALVDRLKPGDIITPAKARTLKNDANADADPELRGHAILQGASAIENLITVLQVAHTASEKERLAFFGEAVDMESAIIMSAFAAAGVPVVTIRGISDAADEDLPIDFDRCLTPQGTVKKMSLVNAIVWRPQNLPNLIRFGRQSNMAARKLATFLDGFVVSLASRAGRTAVA